MLHAPPHVEEHMSENHARRWSDIFGRRINPHAPLEKHVSAETNGACDDAPTVISEKNNKILGNYREAPPPQTCFLSFFRDKSVNTLFNQKIKN